VGVTTVPSFLRIWLDTVRDQPVPTLPEYTRSFPSCLRRCSDGQLRLRLHRPVWRRAVVAPSRCPTRCAVARASAKAVRWSRLLPASNGSV
jgi:hypothetical protein